MAMNKVARMAMEMLRKSEPSAPMSMKNAQRVEKAIRENPKLYRKLSPSQVLDMLNSTTKVIGRRIGRKKGFDADNVPTRKEETKKITKKKFGGIMKGIKAIKDTFNKKDSKGNTTSILGKTSANQQKTKKAIKQTRTTKREKAKSLAKGIIGTTGAYEGMKALKGDKSKAPATPTNKKPKAKKAMPTKTPTPKPKKKSSGVTFGFEVIPKGGKTKKFSGGGKVGGMKSGSATPNRLY